MAAAASEKEFTYAEVSSHASKKDLFVVIHDKVYNSSSFVDEHPYVTPFLLGLS
jgi:cytochrome b involved in lipid metabolism